MSHHPLTTITANNTAFGAESPILPTPPAAKKFPPWNFPLVQFLVLVVFGVLLGSCAGQVPPAGGPADADPPQIAYTIPEKNAVRVEGNEVVIAFSEYVDRGSVEESIFISPPVRGLEYDWSGTDVTITLGDSLKENTTYVVNIGTDVKDHNAGNRMSAGYTLAFSTGDSIDRCSIAGRVFDDKPAGIMVFAYRIGSMDPDTLDPGRTEPNYIMQTGADGSFELSNLAIDTYRILAVRDEYRDLRYARQLDSYGVPRNDIVLSRDHPAVSGVWLRMATEDTSRPFISRVDAVNREMVEVRFSEPIDSIALIAAKVSISDTLETRQIVIVASHKNSDVPTVLTVHTGASLDSTQVYRLRVSGVQDVSGNSIDSITGVYDFGGSGLPDTLLPRVNVVGLTDSVRGYPLSRPIVIQFSRPVLQSPVSSALRLEELPAKKISSEPRWSYLTTLMIVPQKPLSSAGWYQLIVPMDSVIDRYGRSAGRPDSLLKLRFQALDVETTGGIEGTLQFDSGFVASGPVMIVVRGLGTQRVERFTQRSGEGAFAFTLLPEGRYTLQSFIDADGNGRYSPGRPFPFMPSEEFTVLPDTLRLRARWTVEGVTVGYKR